MKPRIAIIGVGSIGQRHAKNLFAMGYSEILGYDRRGIIRGAPMDLAASMETVLYWKPTHALICTPPEKHFLHAKSTLGMGIHTFIEKPMADSAWEASSLQDMARLRHCTLAVGYMERANPTVILAKEFAKNNPIKNAYFDCYWKVTPKTYEQGFLMESSHTIDTARFVLGDLNIIPGEFMCDTRTVEFSFKTKDGNAHCFMADHDLPMRRINLYAHNGKSFGSQYGTEPGEWDECYKAELAAFLNGMPLCDATDGIEVLKLIEGIKNA